MNGIRGVMDGFRGRHVSALGTRVLGVFFVTVKLLEFWYRPSYFNGNQTAVCG